MTPIFQQSPTSPWPDEKPAAGMSNSAFGLSPNPQDIENDAASDYGSEFSPDEVELLTGLLSTTPPPDAVADEPLIITDIEDYEDPKGVRLPKVLGQVKWSPQSQGSVQVQQDDTGHSSPPTIHNREAIRMFSFFDA